MKVRQGNVWDNKNDNKDIIKIRKFEWEPRMTIQQFPKRTNYWLIMNVWDCRNTNKDIIKIKKKRWQGMTFQRELTIDWLWMINAGDWVVAQTKMSH